MLIFKHLGIKFNEEVFNYVEIMIFEEITVYHFDEYKNLGELIFSIYNNEFGKNCFYIMKKKNTILCPITNYSIKKITNMLNINNKNINNNNFFKFIINDKIVKTYRENNECLLEKLSIENDYKYLYNKYHNNVNKNIINKWKDIEKHNFIPRMKKSDIIDLNNFLFSGEQLLNKTLSNLEKNKSNINIKISNGNNYFIPIKDIKDNTKYISIQYIKLINKQLLLYNPEDNYNKFICRIPDFNGKIESISVNNEEINKYYLNSSTEKYIGILINNKKYLIKVNSIKNLLNNYKIINQKYQFNIEFPKKEEKKCFFNEIKINEQNKIRSVEGKIIKTCLTKSMSNNNFIINERKFSEENKGKNDESFINESEEQNDIITKRKVQIFKSRFSDYNNYFFNKKKE